jgi:hypothetical protein
VTQDVNEISSSVGTLCTTTDQLSTRLTDAESNITQNANQITIGVREAKSAAEDAQSVAGDAKTVAESAANQVETISSDKLDKSGITLTVTNNSSGYSKISLKSNNVELASSGNITLGGNVVFKSSLSTEGASVINGSNITTGSISADLIESGTLDAKDIKVKNLKADGVKLTGEFKITGEEDIITTGKITTIKPYIYLEGGVLSGGVNSKEYGALYFTQKVTADDNKATYAFGIKSKAVVIKCNALWTAKSKTTQVVTKGVKDAYIPYIRTPGGAYGTLHFINGILVGKYSKKVTK